MDVRRFNARIDGYDIHVSSSPSSASIKDDWLALQNEETPFFLSWPWISNWIATYTPRFFAITAVSEGRVVAIGLLTQSKMRRHGLVTSRQLRLHQVGEPHMDQIWMEYNDFLCDPAHRRAASNACLKAVQNEIFEWDEIVLSMMSRSRGDEISSSFSNAFVAFSQPCFATDLDAIRAAGKTYLSSLRSNTRYQIRLAKRLYEKRFGPLSIKRAESTEERLVFFREASSYHKRRWDDSGYRNPAFVAFHERLIAKTNAEQVDLLRLTAGNQTLGILYNHIVGKRVFFYLHGLRYHKDPKLKPGLVAHSMASQLYMNEGKDSYDYMGGYSQYKLQLAEQVEDLVTIRLQRPKLLFAVENFGRFIARRGVMPQ